MSEFPNTSAVKQGLEQAVSGACCRLHLPMLQSRAPTCQHRFQESPLAASVEIDCSQVVAVILDSELVKSSEPEEKKILERKSGICKTAAIFFNKPLTKDMHDKACGSQDYCHQPGEA